MSAHPPVHVAADWEYDARRWLSEFVKSEAYATAEGLGFGWVPSEEAPGSWEELSEAFVASLVDGIPLPVATVNVSPSVSLSSEANYAMRFWHAVTHVRLSKGFTFVDEMAVAMHHLKAVEAAGAIPGSMPWRLLRADTVGQNYVYYLTEGGFVADQVDFVYKVLRHGMPFAVLDAMEQIEERSVEPADFDRLAAMLEHEVPA